MEWRGGLLGVSCLAMLCGVSAAQDQATEAQPSPSLAAVDEVVWLDLRVVSVLPSGEVVVDRGARDGVALDAEVRLDPKGALPRDGHVIAVEERQAVVALDGAGAAVAVGSKGQVRVVLAFEPSGEPSAAESPTSGGAPETSSGTERPRPRWERPDDGWTESDPLLARVHAERPEDRTRVIGGRIYGAAGGASTLDLERGFGYLRGGLDGSVTNPFGRGGRLDLDAELDMRSGFVPTDDGSDSGMTRARFDQLSYSWGLDRFSDEGYRLGRFLMGTTPELGRIDGIEWTRRLAGGDRVGANMGYLVENGFDGSTGHDFALHGFYQWVPDERELVSVTGAVEKTFYNGERDRDLLFLRATALPGGGLGPWRLHTALWYDVYDDDDALENGGAELSRSYIQAWRDWESSVRGERDSLGLSLIHEAFAETKAGELDPLFGAGLADERIDRFAVDGDVWTSADRRFFYTAGVWDDEDESGMDVETGVELVGGPFGSWLQRGSHFDVRSFASAGRSSTVLGVGAAYGQGFAADADMGWELAYELLHEDRYGFVAGQDDSLQHRVRYTLNLGSLGASGVWRLAGHAEAILQDADVGFATGVVITRHF